MYIWQHEFIFKIIILNGKSEKLNEIYKPEIFI